MSAARDEENTSLSKDELREGDEISEVFTLLAKRKSYEFSTCCFHSHGHIHPFLMQLYVQ